MFLQPIRRVARILLVLLCFHLGSVLQAGESFYVIVYAYEGEGNKPKDSHTFATFIKVAEEPGKQPELHHHTISWLPVTLQVRALALRPEPGYNLTLDQSLDVAAKEGYRVSLWGPYEIKPELYERSIKQVEHLISGAVSYKAVDAGFNSKRVSNCVHAVSDLVYRRPRPRIGTPAWGEAASYRVLCHLNCYMVNTRVTHDWILTALCLHDRPILRRYKEQWWLWLPH